MDNHRKFQRWITKLTLGQDGLRKLDDLKALEELYRVHGAFQKKKRLIQKRDELNRQIDAASREMVAALGEYAEVREFDQSDSESRQFGFQLSRTTSL